MTGACTEQSIQGRRASTDPSEMPQAAKLERRLDAVRPVVPLQCKVIMIGVIDAGGVTRVTSARRLLA
jgi:hypothetical protein